MILQNSYSLSASILALSVLAAVLPTLLFVAMIYWVDRYEKEPLWLLTATFLWGAVPSILAAFVLNTVFSIPPYLFLGPEIGDVVGRSLIAPPVEESLKGLALIGILILWRHELDSPLDGIIYGAMVGMGFAMVENIYYFVNVYAEGGAQAWRLNIFMRAFVFGLNHALFTSITGLAIAVARLSPRTFARYLVPVLGWAVALVLHLIHNVSATAGGVLLILALFNAWGGGILVVVIIIWSLWQERVWIKRYLAEEVESGTLTPSQYINAYSGWKRLQHRLRLLLTRGLTAYRQSTRFYHRCSQLAYKKHHNTILDEPRGELITDGLRREIAQLSALIS